MTPPDPPERPDGAPRPATTGGPGAAVPAPDEDLSGPDDATTDGGDDESRSRRRPLRSLVEWVAVLGGAVVVALVVRTFLFTTFWIPTGSMEPTLQGSPRNDRVIVNRLSYRLHDVGRGDVVVFSVPPGEQRMVIEGQRVNELIKRVVGLPGETVTLRDGDVYIDGERLAEPYLPEGTSTEPICGDSEFEVPEDAVFVMGDNRSSSRDARCWQEHSVPESDIVGRAFFRIWPLSELGGI